MNTQRRQLAGMHLLPGLSLIKCFDLNVLNLLPLIKGAHGELHDGRSMTTDVGRVPSSSGLAILAQAGNFEVATFTARASVDVGA